MMSRKICRVRICHFYVPAFVSTIQLDICNVTINCFSFSREEDMDVVVLLHLSKDCPVYEEIVINFLVHKNQNLFISQSFNVFVV